MDIKSPSKKELALLLNIKTVAILKFKSKEETTAGIGDPLNTSVTHNVRLLWSGFIEGAQFIAVLFGILFTEAGTSIGRALEQNTATQVATDKVGDWAQAEKIWPEYFKGSTQAARQFGPLPKPDAAVKILGELWDSFSKKFAEMNGFPITFFVMPMSIDGSRLPDTTFIKHELPHLNTNYFAVIIYEIIKRGSEVVLYNVVFNGTEESIQKIKVVDGVISFNLVVGHFDDVVRTRTHAFLIDFVSKTVQERREFLDAPVSSRLGGGASKRRKLHGYSVKKSKRKSKRKIRIKHMKKIKRKYKRKIRTLKRKSKRKIRTLKRK